MPARPSAGRHVELPCGPVVLTLLCGLGGIGCGPNPKGLGLCDQDMLLERIAELEAATASNAQLLDANPAEPLLDACVAEPTWIRDQFALALSDPRPRDHLAPDLARWAPPERAAKLACESESHVDYGFEICGFERYLDLDLAQYQQLRSRPPPSLWVAAWGLERQGVSRALLRRYFRIIVLAHDARRTTPDFLVAHPHAVVLDRTREFPLIDGMLSPNDAKTIESRVDALREIPISLAPQTRPEHLRWLSQIPEIYFANLLLAATVRTPDGFPIVAEVEMHTPPADIEPYCLFDLTSAGWRFLDGPTTSAGTPDQIGSLLAGLDCHPHVRWNPALEASAMMPMLLEIAASYYRGRGTLGFDVLYAEPGYQPS